MYRGRDRSSRDEFPKDNNGAEKAIREKMNQLCGAVEVENGFEMDPDYCRFLLFFLGLTFPTWSMLLPVPLQVCNFLTK